MIDAKTLATTYHALWNDLTPTIEIYLRWINSAGYERTHVPLEGSENKKNRSIISEAAFLLLEYCVSDQRGLIREIRFDQETLIKFYGEALQRVSRFGDIDTLYLDSCSKEDLEEIYHLATRTSDMLAFTRADVGDAIFRPIIPGCGYIDSSEADIVHRNGLFEIKMVDRSFRSIDLKQLLSYLMLNFSAKTYDITKVTLCNPRMGIVFSASVDEFCEEVSGSGTIDLMSKLVHAVSSGELSK